MSHCCISMARKCRSARTRWTASSIPSAAALCGPVNGRRCCPGWGAPATPPPVRVRRRSTRSHRTAAPSACRRHAVSYAVWTAAKWRTRTTSTTTHGCHSPSPSSSSTSSTGPTTCTSKAPAVGVCWGVCSDLSVRPFLCHSLPKGLYSYMSACISVQLVSPENDWLCSCHPSMRRSLWYAGCEWVWTGQIYADFNHIYLEDASPSLCQEYVAFILPRSFRFTQIHNKNQPGCKLQYDFTMSVQQIKTWPECNYDYIVV